MDRASRSDVREEPDALPRRPRGRSAASRATAHGRVRAAAARARRRPHRRRRSEPKADFSKVDATKLTLIDTIGDGRVGAHRQHHARRREPLPRRAADAQPRHRPPARPARPRDRRQSARAGGDRRRVRRGAAKRGRRSSRSSFTILQGAEPGLARRDQRDLRRSQPAPHQPARRARRRAGRRSSTAALRGATGRAAGARAGAGRAGAGNRPDGAVPAAARRTGAPAPRSVGIDRRRCRRHGGRPARTPQAPMPPGCALTPAEASAVRRGARQAGRRRRRRRRRSGCRHDPRCRGQSRSVPADPPCRAVLRPAGRCRRRRRATFRARRSSPRRSWARASRGCRPARPASTSAAARSSGSPASRRASTTSCATCRSRRSASRSNQLESMTIELVAMLFDFIFETRDLPDGIKALLARLQIPVLKAAMLDGAFFAKKSASVARCSSTRWRRRGSAGRRRWGTTIRSTARSTSIVHRILDGFTDNLDDLRGAARGPRGVPRRRGEGGRGQHPVDRRGDQRARPAGDRAGGRQGARSSAGSRRTRCRISSRRSCASTGSPRWSSVYLAARRGERGLGRRRSRRSRTSSGACSRRRTREDRKHLVALLPSLLKRLSTRACTACPGRREERERFMANLVEAHAAAVKPSLGVGGAADRRRRRAGEGRGRAGEGRRRRGGGGQGRGARGGDDAGRAGAAPEPTPRSSTTSSSRSRRASSAACGSSSRPTTASSRSPSSRG